MCCKVLGKEHPDTLTSMNNLALTYSDLGEHEKALELTEKAYEQNCKVLGEEHPNTLTSLKNLASEYGEVGEHEKALELTEKAYELRSKVLGEEHPDTRISLDNLELICSKQESGKKEDDGLLRRLWNWMKNLRK